MLCFEQYHSLDQDLQAHLLWKDGVFLELIRNTHKLNIELYTLYNFYVEVYFDAITEEPLFLKPFINSDLLEPYLQQINLEGLLAIKNSN
jgi:hypothetical protein